MIIYFIKTISYHFFGILSKVISRDKNLWAFGCHFNGFGDNSKYLYLYIKQNIPTINAIWFCKDKNTVPILKTKGINAIYGKSIKGIYYSLKAKYWFTTGSRPDVNFVTSKGAILFNLWHGTPLKKIRLNEKNKVSKYINPDLYLPPNYILTTSQYISQKSFSSAFDVPMKDCKNFGYPRNDIFFQEDVSSYITKNENEILSKIKNYNQRYIYMPTWRDASPDFLADIQIDFEKINLHLKDNNNVLLVKLHPLTPAETTQKLNDYSNILLINKDSDIYPILKYTDCLITDYSSIYFDYLLVDKPIIFFCFDYEDYKAKSRDMYFEYNEVTPGRKIYSALDFENLFSETIITETEKEKEERKRICTMFFDHVDGNSAKRITDFILNHE